MSAAAQVAKEGNDGVQRNVEITEMIRDPADQIL